LITQAELLSNSNDVDGDVLSATNLAITSGSGSLLDNLNATWSYTPVADDETSVDFNYTVSDGVLTAVGSADLDITPVNDAPTTAPVTLAAIGEDSGARLITQAELLSNSNDIDGDILSATNLVITSGSGTLLDNGNGTWSYTPAADDDTSVDFSYTVSDGALTAAGSASLDITPINDTPTTTPVTLAAIAEDSGARLITQAELLSNSNDVDGDVLSATNLSIVSGSGSLLDNLNGTWSYTPAADDETSVDFSYTVSDGALTVAGSASLDITPVNDTPVATDDTVTVSEDIPYNSVTSLLANDSDLDGDSLALVTGTFVTSQGGSITFNADGSYSYTSATNFNGTDSVSYTVTDGVLSDTGLLTLTVTAVNDAPVANNEIFTVNEGSTTTLNLTANDSDVDGTLDLTSIIITATPSNGSVVVNADGTVDYIHDGSETLTDSFSYTILDNSGVVSNTGFINLNVLHASVLAALEDIETDADSETADTSNTENTSPVDDDKEPVEATADEITPDVTNEDVLEESSIIGGIGSIGTRRLLDLPDFIQVDNEPGERNVIIRDNEISTTRKLDVTAIDHLRAQFTGFSDPLQLAVSDSFMSKLDNAHEEMVFENRKFDMVVGGSMSISAGFSVGYAIWLARSGVLMSGLLSSMPAWSFIDPLPVLAGMGKKDDEDDESLESMVEEKEDDKENEGDRKNDDDK